MFEQPVNLNRRNPRKKKCSVKNCDSNSLDVNVRYHTLPKPGDDFINHQNYFGQTEKITRLRAWQMALGIGDTYSKGFMVCSRHFKKDDYLFPDYPAEKRYLKRIAVPSLNLPNKKKKTIDRSTRLLKRQAEKSNDVATNQNQPSNVAEVNTTMPFKEEISATNYLHIILQPPVTLDNSLVKVTTDLKKDAEHSCVPMTREIAVQTDKFTFVSFLKTDKDLKIMTGLESFKVLDSLVQILEKNYSKSEFDKCSLDTRGKIILTFMKLKQNLPYTALAIFFQFSAKHCQRIFSQTISMLSKDLKKIIKWPSRTMMSKDLPVGFKGYEDVRVVLDCTEIDLQHTNKCFGSQNSTNSPCKGGLSAKFMTGVSPSGTLIYVSKMYDGKTSDTAIFNQSDLIQLLEPGDAVMVDKGFLIEETCEKHGWKLYKPLYLKGKQLNKTDSDQSCDMSKARVHVQKSNQRLKAFQIFESSVSCELYPLLEDMFIVICGAVNLSSQVISDLNLMHNDEHAYCRQR